MTSLITQSPSVWWIVAALLATLTTGTLLRYRLLRGVAAEMARNRLDSLRSWWAVSMIVIVCAIFGHWVSACLFAIISMLAMREFVRIAKVELTPVLRCLVAALIIVNYGLIAVGWIDIFHFFLPTATITLFSFVMVCQGRTQGFLGQAAGSVWGLLVTTYMISHVVLLFSLPEPATVAAGGAGWFLLLILLTEANDIMQALIGRQFGKRKLNSVVSPHKTWEGFLGGLVSTTLLAAFLTPWLTQMTLGPSVLVGPIVAITGLFGDLNISALKRDAGVKDSGTMLPGQGGVLDRIDSLTFTAPVFYFFARFWLG